ncbi:PAS domain-containing sensor histidine kinase [Sphingomonas sp. TDK1]|uniref:PAS domain-containing sensor histidine kinase n=1 Tax=Sphingomonas sp. TDK1 TaxID=453247 RepID=UPI0007D9F23A|nr:ATP-binding protein [Sphingomonas sp. TDK1]OAN66569.1 hypothetical protein A7X12_10575 [Sphingomonas sp. TDK1]
MGAPTADPSLPWQFADVVPHLLFRADLDGRVDFLNRWYTELTGHDRAAALRDRNWTDRLHPDDLPRFEAAFAEARATNRRLQVRARLRYADGLHRWMLIVAERKQDAGGGMPDAWYGCCSEIDSEMRAQEEVRDLAATLEARVEQQTAALAREEARYASLFAVSRIAFAEQDFAAPARVLNQLKRDGVTDLAAHMAQHPDLLAHCVASVENVSVNEACARMLGFMGVDSVVDRPVEDTAEDIEAVLLRQFEMIFYGWDNVEGRVVLIGEGGRRVPTFYTVTRLADERQLSSLIDVSSQEKIEEMRAAAQAELARANRVATVGAMSASIAHELNQPIAAMRMDATTGLRWLQREPPNIAAGIKSLERLNDAIERVAGIIAHTRDQISGGAREWAPVDLTAIARQSRDLLARELRAAGVSLALDCYPVPPVLGDAIDLQQVCINLMNNAIDAMRATHPAKRLLAMEVRAVEGSVRVSIADRGSGIADPDKLFQPFFTTKANGVGLGLQICLSTIQRFGGTLTAANRPEGGAVFVFTMPMAGVEEAAQ